MLEKKLLKLLKKLNQSLYKNATVRTIYRNEFERDNHINSIVFIRSNNKEPFDELYYKLLDQYAEFNKEYVEFERIVSKNNKQRTKE